MWDVGKRSLLLRGVTTSKTTMEISTAAPQKYENRSSYHTLGHMSKGLSILLQRCSPMFLTALSTTLRE